MMRLVKKFLRFKAERRYFDGRFYVSMYPDVKNEGIDPFVHYMVHGWREGRDPSADFSTLFYKDAYLASSDLAANPLTHYASLSADARSKTKTKNGTIPPKIYLTAKRHIDVVACT